MIQEEVDYIYDQFLSRVADGRGMTKSAVNVVARGRVWTGEDAKKKGLVDEIGGLTDAINYASEQAGIASGDQIIRYYPKVEEKPWMEFLESLEDSEESTSQTKIPQEMMDLYKRIRSIENLTGIQARLPYEIVD
jgi:protease-4